MTRPCFGCRWLENTLTAQKSECLYFCGKGMTTGALGSAEDTKAVREVQEGCWEGKET